VVFGTGRYLTSTDVFDSHVQTFYGIWDHGAAVPTTDRSQLQQQSFDLQTDAFNREVRSVTGNTPDWASEKGWYLDLLDPPNPPGTALGERVVSTALIKYGRVIFVTVVPSTDPCVPGGSSWLIEVDLLTGGTFAQSVLDLNHDGRFDDLDRAQNEVVNGTRIRGLGISKAAAWLDGGAGGPNHAFKLLTGTGGTFATEINSVPLTRRSWIQIR